MKSALALQTLPSVFVVGTFIASECAAWHLDADPTSPLAWRLNLGVLGAFEHARLALGAAQVVFSPASLPLGLAMLLVIVAAHVARWRFAVALFANLSFMASLTLFYAVAWDEPAHKWRVTPGALAGDAQQLFVLSVLMATFTGFAASHWSFVSTILAHAGAQAGTGAAGRKRRPGLRPIMAGRRGSAGRPSGAAEYC